MTHYRKLISKEMLMNQCHDIHSQDTNASFECYICGVRDTTSSYIINHLGIYHKRLDFYDTFVKEQSIIDDIKESSLLQINNAIINHLDVSNQTSSEKLLQVAIHFANLSTTSVLVIVMIERSHFLIQSYFLHVSGQMFNL